MDGISWSDLNEDEQSTIAMLAAGASADLCDPGRRPVNADTHWSRQRLAT